MAYTITPGTVTANRDLLEVIKQAVDTGQQVTLDVESGRVSAERYRLHGILTAAKVLADECEGRYADLRDRTQVSVQYMRGKTVFVVGPKAMPAGVTVREKDEQDIFEEVKEMTGSVARITFRPSEQFDEVDFAVALAGLNWKLHASAKEVDEASGRVTYGISRVAQERTREAMSALGFGKRKES